MKTSNRLYFIRILTDAYKSADIPGAFARAIEQIKEMGRHKKYDDGYRQFKMFLQEAADCSQKAGKERDDYGSGLTEERPQHIEIILWQENVAFASATIALKGGSCLFHNVPPGSYCLQTGNGRLLWEGILKEADVLWEYFRPGQPLPLAADSDRAKRQEPSREFTLLDGEATLRVFPGLEGARITFDLEESK